MLLRPVLVSVATLLLLSGCTSSGEPEASSIGVTPTPSASPSSAAWSKTEAGRQYLDMTKPTNAALVKLNAEVERDSASLKTVGPLCKGEAAAMDDFMRDLAAGRWPSDVQDEVDAVLKQLARQRVALLRCADATTDVESVDAMQSVYEASSGDASQLLRVALSLPGTA